MTEREQLEARLIELHHQHDNVKSICTGVFIIFVTLAYLCFHLSILTILAVSFIEGFCESRILRSIVKQMEAPLSRLIQMDDEFSESIWRMK